MLIYFDAHPAACGEISVAGNFCRGGKRTPAITAVLLVAFICFLLLPPPAGAAPVPELKGTGQSHQQGRSEQSFTANQEHQDLLEKVEYPSAQECGGCHIDIYREWSVSRHAYAQTSPTFLAYQATLVTLTNGTLGDFCQRCHSQTGMSSSEAILTSNSERDAVSKEGVTCIVCHRVAGEYGKINGRLPLESGDIHKPIYGPRPGDELERVLASQKGRPPKVQIGRAHV